MKVLIVSDTHRNNDNFLKAYEREKPVDMIIHCGDIEGSEYLYENMADVPVYMVAGNNDFFSDLPSEQEFEIEGYRVFLTHGHHYHVSFGSERIELEGIERGADIVIHGHTHRPVIDTTGACVILNPGSLSYPRQEGRIPTYMIMTIDDDGEPSFNLRCVVD